MIFFQIEDKISASRISLENSTAEVMRSYLKLMENAVIDHFQLGNQGIVEMTVNETNLQFEKMFGLMKVCYSSLKSKKHYFFSSL